nr:hypothetical protein [uncultured Mucilaginibacter sp.]
MVKLIRFWFEFNLHDVTGLGLHMGCGVTALTYDDAINILGTTVFKGRAIPPMKRTIENIDVSTLEANHVLPNILASNVRGVWYPIGYN